MRYGGPIWALGTMSGTSLDGVDAAMVLTGLHILAALKHQFLDGDGIFRRMLPI